MYEFTDPSERGHNTLLSLQTIFNGYNLDELLTDENGRFVTLSVGGRGILSRRINHYETPRRHGARERGYTYDVREIHVRFLIEDKTNEGFRERFNRLNGLLLGSQKTLEFTDENAHFIATLQSGDLPDENSNSLQGTLVFICNDPAKRKSTNEIEVTTLNTLPLITGQTSTPWTLEVTFNNDTDKFEAWFGGNYLQLNYNFVAGDRLVVEYTGRKVTLNGNDLRTAVSMSSIFDELQTGYNEVRASHPATLKYDERYY